MITENLRDTISFEQRSEVFYNIQRIKRRTYLANHVDHDLLLRRPRLMSDSQRHRGIAAATWIDEAGINDACHWRPFVEIAHASLDNLRWNETFNVRTGCGRTEKITAVIGNPPQRFGVTEFENIDKAQAWLKSSGRAERPQLQLQSLPAPVLGERRHGGLARRRVAVCRRAIFVVPKASVHIHGIPTGAA
jgi:hypothetical protein